MISSYREPIILLIFKPGFWGFLAFLCFYKIVKVLEWLHDVPDPSGIIFGQRITQNGGARLMFYQFSTFLDKSGPQNPNYFFKKVDPLWPLRPNRYKENDTILILSISGFHQKWPIYWYRIHMLSGAFLEKPAFHITPFETSLPLD